jgi:hypothetical protein
VRYLRELEEGRGQWSASLAWVKPVNKGS